MSDSLHCFYCTFERTFTHINTRTQTPHMCMEYILPHKHMRSRQDAQTASLPCCRAASQCRCWCVSWCGKFERECVCALPVQLYEHSLCTSSSSSFVRAQPGFIACMALYCPLCVPTRSDRGAMWPHVLAAVSE